MFLSLSTPLTNIYVHTAIQSVCGVSGSSLGVSATSFDAHNEVPQSENLDVAVSKHSCSSNLDKGIYYIMYKMAIV